MGGPYYKPHLPIKGVEIFFSERFKRTSQFGQEKGKYVGVMLCKGKKQVVLNVRLVCSACLCLAAITGFSQNHVHIAPVDQTSTPGNIWGR